MRIGLDYDGTYSADPNAWDAFIHLMRPLGHTVSIVTFRDRQLDWNAHLDWLQNEIGIPVHCTGGVAKAWWCENNRVKIDIWVDDRPASILNNSTLNAEQLEQWRAENRAREAALVEIERAAA